MPRPYQKQITPEYRQASLDLIVKDVTIGMYSKEHTMDSLITFLELQIKRVKILKDKIVLDEDTLIKKIISEPVKRILIEHADTLQGLNVNHNIETMTIKDLSKIPFNRFNKFVFGGMSAHHIKDLKNLVYKVGLDLK